MNDNWRRKAATKSTTMAISTNKNIVIISDNDQRAMRLARSINPLGQSYIYDLFDADAPDDSVDLVVVDLVDLSSKVLGKRVSVLREIRGSNVPLLFIAHSSPARAKSHAKLIGATKTVPAAMGPQTLGATAAMMQPPMMALSSSATEKLAVEARQFLVEIFFSGETFTPELAAVGTDLIAAAVAEAGVANWVSAVQRFDNATHQHCLLVAGLAASFATSLGFSRTENFRLTKAALLHDVGKTQIPLSILNKPGPLTADEYAIVRTHAIKGYDILRNGKFSDEALVVARSHHELLDGSGYPDGLREGQICDLVRLVTVCDIFGALIEHRPYKPAMSTQQAFSIIEGMTGRLDMSLVGAFKPVAQCIV